MKKVLAITLALAVLMTLAACGESAPVSAEKATVVGSWEYEQGGYTYTFNNDGTGTYDAAGTIMELTYTDDGSNLSILFKGDTSPTVLPYKIEGNKITITDSFGTPVVYNKK